MPSNKEIAGWLREAANTNPKTYDHWLAQSNRAVNRAALVESMCCETCKYWNRHSETSSVAYCTKHKSMWEYNDSCGHWGGGMFGGKGLANTMADVPNREEEDKARRCGDHRVAKESGGYILYGQGVKFFLNIQELKFMCAESMRCETCRWYDDSYPGSRFGECLNKETRRETNCDLLPDREFLCRHWEGKNA